MKNSLLNKIIEIKKRFKQSANNQADLIVDVLNGMASSFSYQGITMGNGMVVDLSCVTDGSGTKTISVRNIDSQNVEHTGLITADADGDFDLDKSIGTTGLTLNAIMKDVSETMNFNSIIVQACSLFETTHKASVDMVFKYIDSSSDAAAESSRQFKQLLASNCPDGTISQYKFMSILKAVMDQGKNNLDQGTLVLDDSSPFFIVNAICTIIGEVVSAILQAVAQVLLIVGGIIAKIVGFLMTAVGALVSKIQSQVRTNVSVTNKESNTNFFEGAAFAFGSDGNSALVTCFDDLELSSARRVDMGPLTVYVWQQTAIENTPRSSGLMANGFFCPDLHPLRTMQWMLGQDSPFSIDFSGGYTDIKIAKLRDFTFPNSCYYTTEELIELPYASDSDLVKASTFMFAAIGALCLRPSSSKSYNLNGLGRSDMSCFAYASNDVGYAAACCVYTLVAMLWWYQHYDQTLDDWVSYLGNNAGERLTDAGIAVHSMNTVLFNGTSVGSGWYRGNDGLHKTYNMSTTTGQYVDVYCNPLALVWQKPSAPYGNEPVVLIPTTLYYLSTLDLVDAIPQDRTFSFANARWSEIVSILAVTGAIMTATIVVAAVGRAKFKRWSMQQQSKQWDHLQTARSAYIDSDTGAVIGGQADFKAYYKAIKKYNRMGRFLGYGYYDPVNNWNNGFDVPAPSIDTGSSTDLTNNLLSDITDDGKITLNSLMQDITGNQDSDSYDLKRICKLITG